MANTGEIENLFKSRKVLLDLLKKRDFNVNDYEGSSVTEIDTMHKSKQLDMLVERPGGKKAYIKYHIAKNLRVQNIYEYIEDLFEIEQLLDKKDDLIIIQKDEPNDSLKQLLRNIWAQDKIFITVFNIKRLLFNIMNHTLVPPHRTLSSEEDKEVRAKYNITNDSDIPDISRFSPVAMVIGIRPGEICEIIRPSRTAIKTTFYRICSV